MKIDLKEISISEVVENYLENRLIWAELVEYRDRGKVLGQHPIFAEMNRQDELEKLEMPELIKLEKNLLNKINRTKAQIAKGDKPHLNKERQDRVDEFEIDYRCVKRLLKL